MKKIDFRQLEAFVNVVRYKSFSRAADASFLTQPTVSTHISSLEKELGVMLIDRKSKEAVPTPEGRCLYSYALDIMNTRDKAISTIQKNEKEIEGVMEIQASSVPGGYIVPGLLSGFREKYPRVKFYLEQSDSRIVERNLLENKGEIGFVGDRRVKDLAYEKLLSDRMVLIAPKNKKFLALAGTEIALEQMIDEPFIWREQGSATRKEFEDQFTAWGKDPKSIRVVARMNSLEAVKQAVGSGLGVSVISELAANGGIAEQYRNFLTFSFRDVELKRDFYMVWNKKTTLSDRAEAFRDYVARIYNSVQTPLE